MAEISKINANSTSYDIKDAPSRTALGEVINGGAAGTKNLAPISTIQKTTTTAHYTSIIPCYFKAGTYHIKFGYTTAQVATFVLRNKEGTTLLNLPANIPKGTGTYNANFTISEDCYGYHIYGENAVELTDIMICRKTLYDANPDYEPYAPAKTNVEITPALIEQVDSGAKNKYPPFETQSSRGSTGVTYSYTNGIVHATGTKSGSLNYIEVVENRPIGELGFSVGDTLVLSNTSDSLLLTIILGDGTTFDPAVIVGNETKELIVGAGKTHIYVRCQILSSVTGTIDLSATPMICTAADWNVSQTYVPYAKTNRELTVAEDEDRSALIGQVDGGAKNYCPYSSFTSPGAATVLNKGAIDLPAGEYVLSYKVTATTGQCGLRLLKDEVSLWNASISNTTGVIAQELKITENANQFTIYTAVANTISDIMICPKSAWDVSHAYEPYALPNPTLTPAAIKAVDEGAKNLLRFDETSTDNNNVRFTVNADGSITATQIATRTATAVFRMRHTDNLLSQDVRGKILSGCPSGGSDSTYKINIERRTSPYTNYGRDTGNGLLIPETIADDIPLYLYIQVYSSATLPLTFKPMICSAADWAISQAYQPYRPSWQEMYDMILALQSGTRSAPALAKAEPETGEEEMQ